MPSENGKPTQKEMTAPPASIKRDSLTSIVDKRDQDQSPCEGEGKQEGEQSQSLSSNSKADEHGDVIRLLGYEVGSEIGKSLFGKVYLCVDRKTGAKVAIKSSRRTKQSTKWESPEEEWRLMRLVTKPQRGKDSQESSGSAHILPVLNFVKTRHWMYTVGEYCNKGDLFDLVSKVVYLEEHVAREYFRQTLMALKHIHSYGVYHLDVSLENLFLDQQDTIKLADFGCARRWNKGKRANFGKYRPGKWQYMCPEIFTWQPCYGELADVWSAGVALFIMLTGKAPFRIPSNDDGNFRRVYYEKDFSRCHISDLAKDLLSKMLCPPEDRFKVADILRHPWMFHSLSFADLPPLRVCVSPSSPGQLLRGRRSVSTSSTSSTSPFVSPFVSPFASPFASPCTSSTHTLPSFLSELPSSGSGLRKIGSQKGIVAGNMVSNSSANLNLCRKTISSSSLEELRKTLSKLALVQQREDNSSFYPATRGGGESSTLRPPSATGVSKVTVPLRG